LADLFGNKTEHKDEYGSGKKKYRHIGKAMLGEIGIKII
jgi:hypothetical protein